MTDLISSLADQLVALNNASPRLPTKQQIEEVLRKHLLVTVPPGALMTAYGWYADSDARPLKVKWSQPSDPTSWTPNTDEWSAVLMQGCKCGKPADATGKYWPSCGSDCHTKETLKLSDIKNGDLDAAALYRAEADKAAALEATADDFARAARQHATAAWSRLTPAQRTLCQCPGYASGLHHWEVDPWSTRDVRPDEVANRCVCGATKP